MSDNITPTKSNLMQTEASLELARNGYELMDRKRSILMREAAKRSAGADEITVRANAALGRAMEALKRAERHGDNIAVASACIPVDDSIRMSVESVMGIDVPTVTCGERENGLPYTLGGTSAYLDEAYFAWNEVRSALCELAQTRAAGSRLAAAARQAGRRENALGNIMIPRLEGSVKYIADVLDEREREEFSRLKVIKG